MREVACRIFSTMVFFMSSQLFLSQSSYSTEDQVQTSPTLDISRFWSKRRSSLSLPIALSTRKNFVLFRNRDALDSLPLFERLQSRSLDLPDVSQAFKRLTVSTFEDLTTAEKYISDFPNLRTLRYSGPIKSRDLSVRHPAITFINTEIPPSPEAPSFHSPETMQTLRS